MIKNILASSVIFFSSLMPAYSYNADDGLYYFRWNKGVTSANSENPDDDNTAKDITAYFVGGINKPFSEKLPLRPQWENDSWQIVQGTLPDGITFNTENNRFEGTPTKAGRGTKVEMVGIGRNGEIAAEASITFDVFVLPENTLDVDLYAHTDKYISHMLPLPEGVVVHRWERIYAAPKGVTINERYFDGTPQQEGIYPVLIQGYNYLGEAIIAYLGTYTVENGPSFPLIADNLLKIKPEEGFAKFDFTNAKINRAVKDATKVRYWVEIDPADPLPGSVRANGTVFERRIQGNVINHYEDGLMRYMARDTDGTEGYSNWFRIGTLGPDPQCKPTPTDVNGQIKIPARVDAYMGYSVPVEDARGEKLFTMIEGNLPGGITFNQTNGSFSGTPLLEERFENIRVRVDVTNAGNVDSTECGPYTIDVQPADFGLTSSIDETEVRVGNAISAKLTMSGKLIEPYSIEMEEGSSLPTGVNFDPQALTLSGIANEPGIFSANFKLKNGNGHEAVASVAFRAYPPLSISDASVPPTIPRYNLSEELTKFTYDAESIIGEPYLTIVGSMPEGFYINDEPTLIGGSKTPDGNYGPYRVRLSDDSGEFAETSDFFINVSPREDMRANATVAPTFTKGKASTSSTIFSVIQPPLANELPLTWTITPSALPTGLSFNNGVISGTPSQVGVFPDFRITVTDSEGYNKTSEPFEITVLNDTDEEVPEDDIPTVALPEISGNVTGPTVTFMTSAPIDFAPIAETLVGGIDSVRFTGIDPEVPGLIFDTNTGILSGNPTSEFSDVVTIKYRDGADREGLASLPVKVYPYPELIVPLTIFDAARLEEIGKRNIRIGANSGFFGGITWSLASPTNSLPAGITFQNGTFVGTSSAPEGLFNDITVSARDNTTGIRVVSEPFAIRLGPAADMGFNPSPSSITFYLDEDMNEVKHDAFLAPSMKPSGSFVEPLAYSITSAKPTGLAINPTTGQFSSAPGVFGDWPITIRVTDAEQTAAEAVIQVKSTLNGHIIASPGNIDKKYRTGETFETPTQSFSNIMSNVELTLSGSTRPVDLNFSYTTGKFNGLLSTPGQYNYNLSAKDSGNRTLEKPVEFRFEIVPPLTIKTPQSIVAKQYSKTSDIKVEAPEVENSMGKITFQLLGEVPGTLITRQNNNGTISYYSHIDGLARPISLENFPLDAIVFDTNTGSLTGIPSKIGQYPIAITAVDDHRDDYLNMDDATRVSHNTAVSSIITINVGSPDALTLVASENPHHIERPYDDASAIVTAAGFAYGVAPTLTIENPSALPPGVTYTTAAHQLLFTGTSDTRGSYKGVNVKVTDVAGRSHSMPMEFWVYSTSDPIILNVSDIYTKPGYTFTTSLPWTAEEVTTDRTFGEIAFFSDELENLPQVLLNPETGAISGKFDETGLHRFNLNVGDETPRLTSEPVIINVIPFLRIIAPNVVPLDVDGYNDEVVATDYNIGKVKFRKGAGIWPVGISVDEDTGSIKGVPQGGIATYPGLTIIGVDEIGDEQASNVFSISVEALGPYVQLLSGPLETAVKRQAYNFDLTENLMILQEIPNNELTWSITAVGQDQNLPSGLSIVNGALTGTPSFGGNFQFTITATWSKQPAITAKQVYRLQVDLPELAINFDETTLDEADTAMIYNFDLSTLISTTNLPKDQVTFQIHADKPGQRLPTGLDLEGKNLTGFATEGGTFNFTILARFANAQELSEKEADVSLTVIDLGADVSWRKIATANLKSCGISLDYDLYCWGLDNSSGSSIAVNVPTKVELLDGVKVKDISFTNTKSCVITLDGGVKCWGGTTTDGAGFGATVALRDVPGFTSGVEKISVGFNHQCLLKEERAYCWGVGTSGQLGHGSAQSKTTPNMVMWGTGMPLITQDISASQNSAYTCAVKKDTSQVLCFGAPGSYTRLGKAGTANVSWPTPVNDTALYQSVETGVDTACGILTSGQLKCWGRNQSGVLGIATTTASVNGPRAIAALANVKAVTIGGDWLCAINSNDGTQCLGQALRIGTGAAASGAVTTPQSVGIGSPVIGVSGNTTHTCAVTSYGEGFCWGLNSWGQVGSGTVGANETSPRPVDSP